MVDRISKLPDVLISDKILTHLYTKDVVRTSVLSTKWRNLWQTVPGLDLDSLEFSNRCAFLNFVDKFFESNRESQILKLKLIILDFDDATKSHLNSWIDDATKRKIQQLNFCFHTIGLIPMTMSIYTCETLVQLQLSSAALDNVEFVSLPCLKIMYLQYVRCLNYEATVEKLISGSPVLEDLTIIRCYTGKEKVIQVRSKTVKRIHIDWLIKVVIDAPLLRCLKTEIIHKKNYKIICSAFPVKLDIHVVSTVLDVSEILIDISKVRELVINEKMWKEIFHYSKPKPLLHFPYLTCLKAIYPKSKLELLPTLLESCPKLESLILVEEKNYKGHHTEDKEPNVTFSTVPQCLVSSLKFLELKSSRWISELVRYFLKNSTSLKKLRLDNYYKENAKYDNILKELLAMPRCSRACEIVLL